MAARQKYEYGIVRVTQDQDAECGKVLIPIITGCKDTAAALADLTALIEDEEADAAFTYRVVAFPGKAFNV